MLNSVVGAGKSGIVVYAGANVMAAVSEMGIKAATYPISAVIDFRELKELGWNYSEIRRSWKNKLSNLCLLRVLIFLHDMFIIASSRNNALKPACWKCSSVVNASIIP